VHEVQERGDDDRRSGEGKDGYVGALEHRRKYKGRRRLSS
jgi:hypothetical protein